MRTATFLAACLILAFALACGSDGDVTYDPLALDGRDVTVLDLTARDGLRQRDIPLRVYLPAQTEPGLVVLYSHGLGGARTTAAYLGQHWAARGYIAVFMQHPGSDESVWRNLPPAEVFPALAQAANAANFLARVLDVSAVIDQLTAWNTTPGHPLNARLDLSRIGMSGHSFGAMTTQAVSGQYFPAAPNLRPHPSIKAAIAFSPSAPAQGDAATAFGSVSIPWLLMTGTKDEVAALGAVLADRLKVYPALPETIDKYELVLYDAEHFAFTERSLTGSEAPRNPNHHRVILALSTAFWDAYLRDDRKALEWLQGDGARSVLEERDAWRFVAGATGKR